MSTRSQLRFIENGNVAQVYKHSDGYPEGILPMLADLRDLLHETGAQRGPSYTAANFIWLCKMGAMEFYQEEYEDPFDVEALKELDQPFFLLGYGVEDVGRWHGDEEYLYEVVLSRPDPGSGDTPPDWQVHVSEHNGFPRWDDLDDYGDPWDYIDWQFKGSLDDAIDELT